MIEINAENILRLTEEKLGSEVATDVLDAETMKWDLSNWRTHFTRKQAIYWEVVRLAYENGMSIDEVQQGLIDGYFLLEIDFDKKYLEIFRRNYFSFR